MQVCAIIGRVLLCLILGACYSHQEQVELNIKQLKQAEDALMRNPKDAQALSLIIGQLHDEKGVNRVNAAAVLGNVGQKTGAIIKDTAVPALAELLDKGDAFDKRAAAEALSHFGSNAREAVPILQKNLFPSDRDTAWFSARALGEIGEAAGPAVPDLMRALRENINECEGYFSNSCGSFIPAIAKIGSPARSAEPELENFLKHRDPYVRMRIAVALIGVEPGSHSGYETLDNLLKSPDSQVRRRTIDSVSEIGSRAAPIKGLIERSLKDPDEEVREAASAELKLLNNWG